MTREEFGWPFGRVVALATVLLLVAMMLGLLVGLIAVVGLIGLSAQIGNNASSVGEVVELVLPSFMGSVFLVGASYFVGRWIGYRCRDRVVVALVLAVVLARGIVLVLDMSVLGYEQYSELLSRFDASVWQFLASLGFFMGSGMIGVWRGRKTRASYYLHYVLQSMPQDSRNTLLELAHSEAVRLKGGRDKEEQIPPRGSSGYT